ncbi:MULTISPECIES: alpha/beta fold hydrolase [unclassified Streptomyces]|uniref:alpha/beta fold hydrolase n=1 Tax=unclassified Streptomyces TaxID=2593676 RepID=UPI001BEBCBC4|nr:MULTISPECIES: alpha/beta hydrolase [unclassified Streptomyces]MBT2408744.1 alpha/beta fold hydrolase [Streptomyces sp. ISL-21]MBT2609571.1 alpha/beta fold hydrolase [Streptomyces sp. ISL-87]
MSSTATTSTTTTAASGRVGTLRVPGAVLHYQLQGSGPLLLISQSGEGDADRTVDLVPHLTDAFTVLTYDRRGLSRSRLDEPGRTTALAEHAEDVHRLLAAVTDEPALMLGCSLGAVIGLHLAAQHPGQVAALVAHEPVAPRLLPPDLRARHEAELAELQAVYRTGGLAAAFPEMARVLGIDLSRRDIEPGLTPQPLDDRRRANFGYFIEHDFSAIIQDTLDPEALAGSATRIIPALGEATPSTVFDHQCATALADLLDTEIQIFPGGHNGNSTHPKAYAARLRGLLAAHR